MTSAQHFENSMIHGIGDEVSGCLVLVLFALVSILIYLKLIRSSTHAPLTREATLLEQSTNQTMSENEDGSRQVRHYFSSDNRCPICLGHVRCGVETNCGHLFCGECIISYWMHRDWVGAVRCPVCRQQVVILLNIFNETEIEQAQNSGLTAQINTYNRRFSGEPRPILDYVRDLPTLLRHVWNEFFSVGGLVYMFRIRILLCFVAGVMYLVSPLDILPEALFGLLGFFDDVFVVVLLAIYVSIIYRRLVVER